MQQYAWFLEFGVEGLMDEVWSFSPGLGILGEVHGFH
jgi:hypothetical protein